ncbi:MAG: hypothetical protein K0S12_1346 [Bacteroidetes bacterium]|jgi:hypothetical protein|nr:hypothetical protein [Bacteroidota bacterium]
MNTTTITQKVIDGLQKAVVELEQLQVQVALGKAEARDLYNDQKKRFNIYIHSVKEQMGGYTEHVKDDSQRIKELLLEIGHHLEDIKVETSAAFEEQRKSLLKLFSDLEEYIRSDKALSSVYSDLLMQVEIFKLKMEILKFRFDLKKLSIKEEFEKNKALFLEKINELKTKVKNDLDENGSWDRFQTEMGEAYKHIKHAFGR